MQKNDIAGLAHAKKLIEENARTQASFLDLGNCGLVDLSELPELWELGYLEGLNMGNWYKVNNNWRPTSNNHFQNNIGDKGAIAIAGNLTKLTSLDLSDNQIGDEGVRHIAENLKLLTSLNLSDNEIEEEGARHIAENLKLLTSLYLAWNQIGNEGAIHIAENLKLLTSLDLSRIKIGEDGARYIAGNLKLLTLLDLSFNQLGDEGARHIAKNLKQLTSLDLAWNQIGDGGARHIAENLKQLTSLDLSRNKIEEEGARHIAENLKLLTSLNLAWNQLGDEGARHIAKKLKLLTSLNLAWNQLGDEGARHIAENLKLLTSLDLSRCKIEEKGAKHIAENLKLLTSLDLSDNEIEEKGARQIAENLKQLTSLDLSRCEIEEKGAKHIAENLKLLTSLDLAGNEIGDEGARHIAENLKLLTSLNLSNNEIGKEGAKHIAENLKLLTSLDLADNEIGDEGAKHIAENLIQLNLLDLSRNQIGDAGVMDFSNKLTYLTNLDLSYNKIKNIKNISQLDCLDELSVSGNPFKDIPHSLIYEYAYIKNWWSETESNTEPNQIIKLMVNGNGNVGKSTLIEALQKGMCETEKDSTHGIIIEEWHYEEANKQVDFHIWDFGGQEIFHGTHRLFMQAEAVWLHVFDAIGENAARNHEAVVDRIIAEESGQNHVIQYWMDEAKSSNQRVIIQTKKEKKGYETRDEVVFDMAHAQKTDFVFIDSFTGNGIHRLRSIIHEKGLEINEYGMPMPAKWIAIRKYFLDNLQKEDNQKLISRNAFDKLCTEQFGILENVIPTLITFLHHSGVIYYNAKFLGDTIIADQSWAINAIYQPLKRDSSFYHNMRKLFYGRVTLDIVYDAFGGAYTKPQKALFVNLMESCGLCYAMNTPKSTTDAQDTWYVFPEFLPSEPSTLIETLWSKVATYRTFIKKLPYLNYYRIQQYISKYGKKTEKELVWRNGVMLNTTYGMVRVEADYKNPSIVIKIEKSIIDDKIADILEIKHDSQEERNTWIEILETGAEIPLTLNAATSNHSTNDIGKKENFIESLPDVSNKEPFKLAVSFASEDLQALEDLAECMEDFTHNGRLQLLYDKNIIDGKEGFDASLRKMFENADGYLILASMKYQNRTKKTYIWENEIPIIKDRHEKLKIPTWLLAVGPVRLNTDLESFASFRNCKEELPEEGYARTKYLLAFVEEVVEGKYLKEK